MMTDEPASTSLPLLSLLLCVLGCAGAQAQAGPALEVTFLDVGQGDAVLLRAPEGQTALVDTGPGRRVVARLAELGVSTLDLLVTTHPHADHIGGAVDVINAVPVHFYMDNAQPHTTVTYRELMQLLAARSDITYLAAEPRTISLGSATIEVLPLPPPDAEDLNNRSVGLVVRLGRFSVFLSGDSERRELGGFVRAGVVPDVTVLKAAHHGSANGFTQEFLGRARPEVVVISVGQNEYGHPMPEALSAYASVAHVVYRTDRDGNVTIRGQSDGSYDVILGNAHE